MKRPTQADVARLAGVSTATVSYVINNLADGRVPISEETRQRVLEAIEALGYEPDARAQALRLGHTKTVGLILPDIHNPHFWQTADGVEQELRAAGYHLLLSTADLDPDHGKEIFKEIFIIDERKKELGLNDIEYSILTILKEKVQDEKLLAKEVKLLHEKIKPELSAGWEFKKTIRSKIEKEIRLFLIKFAPKLSLGERNAICNKIIQTLEKQKLS